MAFDTLFLMPPIFSNPSWITQIQNNPLFSRILNISISIFQFSSNASSCSYALKEWILDLKITPQPPPSTRFKQAINWLINLVRTPMYTTKQRAVTILHAGLTVASALLGIAIECNRLGWIVLGNTLSPIFFLSNATSFVADGIYLPRNIQCIKLAWKKGEIFGKISSVAAIITNLFYMTYSTLAIGGVPWPLLVTIGTVAGTLNTVKLATEFIGSFR